MARFLQINPQPLAGTYPNPATVTAQVTVTDDFGDPVEGAFVNAPTANTGIAVVGSGPFETDVNGFVFVTFALTGTGTTTASFQTGGAASVTVQINATASASAPNWTIFLDTVDGSPPAAGQPVSFNVGQTRALQYRVYDLANNVDGASHPVVVTDDGSNPLFSIQAPASGNTNSSGRFTVNVTANAAGSGENITATETVQNKTAVNAVVVNSVIGSIQVNGSASSLKIYPEFSDNGVVRVVVRDTTNQVMAGVTVSAAVVSGSATLAQTSVVTNGNPAFADFNYSQAGSYTGFATIRFTVGSLTVDQVVKIAKVTTITPNPASLTSPYQGPVQNIAATVSDNFGEFVTNRFNFLSATTNNNVAGVQAGWNTDGSGIAQIPITFGIAGAADITLRTPTSAVLATIPVTVSAQVIPPQITSPSSATAAIGQPFTFTPTGTGSGPLTWSIVGVLPSWLDFNQAGGAILYSPTVTPNNTTPEQVTFRLCNSAGCVDQVFTINKVVTGTAPVITSVLTIAGQVGQPFSYQLNASGTDPKTWAILSATQGFTLNPSTGLLTHPSLPPPAGNTTLQIEVSNGISPSDNKLFTIQKSAAPVPSEVMSILQAIDANVPFSQVIQVSNNPTAVTVTAPSWATVTSSGSGSSTVWTLSGTAPISSVGSQSVSFSLTNAAGVNTQTLPITVNLGDVITFITAASWTGAHGQFNRFTHKATGGVGAITYSLAGNDPAITINPQTGEVTVSPSLP
jgi:hypothetical protein